jgi:hypothetical protein
MMIKINFLSGKYYGIILPNNNDKAIEEINSFILQGNPVILVDDLDDLEELGIFDTVIMVERD